MNLMHNQNTHIGPSFSIRNRIGRLLWSVVYFLLFSLSPKPFHGWRRFLLKLFGAEIGAGVHVYPKVKIWAPWNLKIGDQAGIANGANLYSQAQISIGRRAVVSQGAHICAGSHDYKNPGFPLFTSPIEVGDFAWVAADAFVHPGVIIGEGCVIGARSVVANDMPAWMVCVGFPCKPIKPRIPTEEIENFKKA